jgi:hypothetical protein
LEPVAPHLQVGGAAVSGEVVGVIPAGAVGALASVGDGVGGWAGGVPVGAGVGVLSGIGRLIRTALGDPGGMAIRDTFTIIRTDYLGKRILSISRVVPIYAATATRAPSEVSTTGSSVSAFTISK